MNVLLINHVTCCNCVYDQVRTLWWMPLDAKVTYSLVCVEQFPADDVKQIMILRTKPMESTWHFYNCLKFIYLKFIAYDKRKLDSCSICWISWRKKIMFEREKLLIHIISFLSKTDSFSSAAQNENVWIVSKQVIRTLWDETECWIWFTCIFFWK